MSYQWGILGGQASDGIIASARLTEASANVRLRVSKNPGLSGYIEFGPVSSEHHGGNWHIAMITATGLEPYTKYHGRWVIDGTELVGTGDIEFRTFPKPGQPASFVFGSASCNESGSNHEVFEHIASEGLLFFWHKGDWGYPDPGSSNIELWRENYDLNFSQSRQHALWRKVPIIYSWDDHDFGPNNSSGYSGSGARRSYRNPAVSSYRQTMPVREYGSSDPLDAIYSSQLCGRVLLVNTDDRADRWQGSTSDTTRPLLGEQQLNWFFGQLEYAAAMGFAVIWECSVPWIASGGSDTWAGHQDERNAIRDKIVSLGLDSRLIAIAGDMHATAIDDGRNNAWGGFPVFQAAPLDKGNSSKGGPYWLGPYTQGAGQWMTFAVSDSGGDTIEVQVRGRQNGGDIPNMSYTASLGPLAPPTPVDGLILRPAPEHLVLWLEGALDDPDWEPTRPTDRPPVFQTSPPTSVRAGQTYVYNGIVTDADGDPITVTLEEGPDWLTLTDHGDGTFTLEGIAPNE